MTTSPMPSPSEAFSSDAKIPDDCLVYFQDRFRNRLYDLVIGEFEQAKIDGLTQAKLARRLGKKPEQIHKWLSSPGNWTLNTVSNLLLGISSAELTMGCDRVFIAPTLDNLQFVEFDQTTPNKSNESIRPNFGNISSEAYYCASPPVTITSMMNILATVAGSDGE